MDRKTVDHPRKTVESAVKTTQSGRMAGPCYKSLRQNGAKSRRNSRPDKYLELRSGCLVFMSKIHKELRPITTDGRRQNIHKALLNLDFGDEREFSTGVL